MVDCMLIYEASAQQSWGRVEVDGILTNDQREQRADEKGERSFS